MKYTTLREIIDDILLIVRNNNISESEDLSRSQIAAWVKHYKSHIWKMRRDQFEERLKQYSHTIDQLLQMYDDEYLYVKEVGPMELECIERPDGKFNYTRRTKNPLVGVFNDTQTSILAVHDEDGENIQYMNHIRRHYHNFRKYTFGEVTAYYMPSDGRIYIQGIQDMDRLKYIYVLALYDKDLDNDEDDPDLSEDDIKVPTWMVPLIKKNIMDTELAFMLNRPSDDSNNATLASVKPHGPQDQEE